MGYSDVVSAVLWRLLYNWNGSPATTTEDAIPAGPVLEVLFLATLPGFRQQGEAQTLVKELEEAARSLGCAAMCVAAVPRQGVSFWTRCGYTTMVALKNTSGDGGAPLDEPTSLLGGYPMQAVSAGQHAALQ